MLRVVGLCPGRTIRSHPTYRGLGYNSQPHISSCPNPLPLPPPRLCEPFPGCRSRCLLLTPPFWGHRISQGEQLEGHRHVAERFDARGGRAVRGRLDPGLRRRCRRPPRLAGGDARDWRPSFARASSSFGEDLVVGMASALHEAENGDLGETTGKNTGLTKQTSLLAQPHIRSILFLYGLWAVRCTTRGCVRGVRRGGCRKRFASDIPSSPLELPSECFFLWYFWSECYKTCPRVPIRCLLLYPTQITSALETLFSLWALSSVPRGGLDWSSDNIGKVRYRAADVTPLP